MIVPMKELSGKEAFDPTGFCASAFSPRRPFISGTVERPTADKETSQCFAIGTDASSHPISCGMAPSRNWPQRIQHFLSRRWCQRL
jgi:hypothetical protein